MKKYPIILEKPSTRVVIEFLLKQFGLRIPPEMHVLLCQKEICEIDSEVLIKNHNEDYENEHFVCVFSLDRERGILPLLPLNELQHVIRQRRWPDPEERKIKDFLNKHKIVPDFIITFGRLEMPSGMSSMCWCVHEFIKGDPNDPHGIFDGLETVPDIVRVFTNYIWNIPNLIQISPKALKEICDEEYEEGINETEEENVIMIQVEEIIINFLKKISVKQQRNMLKCFLKKKGEESILKEVNTWNECMIKQYILQNNVLLYFPPYQDRIVHEMISKMYKYDHELPHSLSDEE